MGIFQQWLFASKSLLPRANKNEEDNQPAALFRSESRDPIVVVSTYKNSKLRNSTPQFHWMPFSMPFSFSIRQPFLLYSLVERLSMYLSKSPGRTWAALLEFGAKPANWFLSIGAALIWTSKCRESGRPTLSAAGFLPCPARLVAVVPGHALSKAAPELALRRSLQ